ncbi:MAG: hypothetical protein IPL63_14060 [Saprospiraceae bacterium]|nr:hypothetical protein [Saprospiraceae bacterium]
MEKNKVEFEVLFGNGCTFFGKRELIINDANCDFFPINLSYNGDPLTPMGEFYNINICDNDNIIINYSVPKNNNELLRLNYTGFKII